MSDQVRRRVYDAIAGIVVACAIAGTSAVLRMAVDIAILRRDLTQVLRYTEDHEQRIRALEATTRGRP